MKNSFKNAKQMERHLKGISNHWRIEILLLLSEDGGLYLEDICDSLKMNTKTASEHTRRLVQAGLVNKKHSGRMVEHSLSPYGKKFSKFLKDFKTTFQHS